MPIVVYPYGASRASPGGCRSPAGMTGGGGYAAEAGGGVTPKNPAKNKKPFLPHVVKSGKNKKVILGIKHIDTNYAVCYTTLTR